MRELGGLGFVIALMAFAGVLALKAFPITDQSRDIRTLQRKVALLECEHAIGDAAVLHTKPDYATRCYNKYLSQHP